MILVEDLNSRHKSLIKISKRVYSENYVPANIFTLEWMLENYEEQSANQDSASDSGNTTFTTFTTFSTTNKFHEESAD